MRLRYSLFALTLTACGGATAPSYGGNNPPPPDGGGGVSASVSVANYAFSPNNLTVKVGATVTWSNHDDVAHTVTDDSASPAFNASLAGTVPDPYGGMTGGGTFQYTFTSAGTFHYHCNNHATMAHATVTVNP